MFLTFRLYPKPAALKKLYYAIKLHKDLYNAAIANRKTQYEKFGHSVNYLEQQNSLPAFKEVWTEYKELGSHTLQATLKRVDLAYQSFKKDCVENQSSSQSKDILDGLILIKLVGKSIPLVTMDIWN